VDAERKSLEDIAAPLSAQTPAQSASPAQSGSQSPRDS
jgi:hypothetical protein